MKIFRHALVVVGTLVCFPALAQDYEIRLDHRYGQGDKYKLSASARQVESMSASSAGKVVRENKIDITVQLESLVTVLAVGAKGQPVRESHAVSQLTQVTAGNRKQLVSSGTTIVAYFDGTNKVFTINGTPAPRELTTPLGLVIDVSRSEETDDDVFGTKERKKVGESWPIQVDLLMKSLRPKPSSQKNASGKGTLKQVVTGPQGPVLIVEVEATILEAPPIPGFTVEESKMDLRMTGRYPVNPAASQREDHFEATLFARGRGKVRPDAPEVEMSRSLTKSATFKRTLIH